ncbi:hypothetical protein MTX78_19135 [Hymenobacter tibetensis]|uniref:Uncharacterized protein n=1 Tax=Hymenobacter tibetensis TaxID=497967 RepID=A0ABY4CVC9_9BACT|nr:hypothetical protein [Hymenobacter tibetensis]UOG74223.1 hypothetical protein MTX78_19135 [Hymenobacter tibetensis]
MPSTLYTIAPIVPYTEYLNLSYRPDLQLVVLRWLRDASLAELKVAHQAALELALRHQVTNWFVDVRRRQAVNSNNTRWVADDFLPQAALLLLPRILRVAYLTSPSRQHIIDTTPEMYSTVERAQGTSQPYLLRSFLDEAVAMAWLFEENKRTVPLI